jgi:ADP-ribose pyrophosphatase YjhB (NUDIX family)
MAIYLFIFRSIWSFIPLRAKLDADGEMDERQLRERAAAVVIRKGKVLLVKDKTLQKYSLPGGGVHEGETLSQAVARELFEETGLKARRMHFIGSFRGAVSHHKAFLVQAEGHAHLKNKDEEGGGELSSYVWWDMKSPLPVYQHVKVILDILKKRERERQ